jgi:hypothetical protein
VVNKTDDVIKLVVFHDCMLMHQKLTNCGVETETDDFTDVTGTVDETASRSLKRTQRPA